MANYRFIAPIEPAGDFALTNVEYIEAEGGVRLGSVINSIQEQLSGVITEEQVDEKIADVNQTIATMQADVDSKADANSVYTKNDVYQKSEVDTRLTDKVDKQNGYGLISDADRVQIQTNKSKIADAENSLATKASNETVSEVERRMSVQESRMDQIVGEVPAGSADEIADARVDETGKAWQNLGDHIRGSATRLKEQYSELKEDLINSPIPIEKYGAMGDGITDDSDALENALKKSSSIVLGKNKIYLCKRQLQFTSGYINIEGNNSTIIFKITEEKSEQNSANIEFKNSYVNLNNLTIDGGIEWIDRPFQESADYENYRTLRAKTRHGISLSSCGKSSLTNIVVKNCQAGYFITDSINIRIINSRSEYTLGDGVFITGSSNTIFVNNHRCINVDDDSYTAIAYKKESVPTNILFLNCVSNNGFGALITLIGCYNAKAYGCSINGCRFTPFKLGNHEAFGVNGSHQIVYNCVATLSDVLESYSGDNLTIINSNDNNTTNNIIVDNCYISYNATSDYTLLINNAIQSSIQNNRITGLNVKFNNCNNLTFSGNRITINNKLSIAKCENITMINNIINNKTENEYKALIICSNSGNIKIIGNIITSGDSNELSIFNNTNRIIFDIRTISVTNIIPHTLEYLGTFYLVSGIPTNAFKTGQLLYSSGRMLVVFPNEYKEITFNN